MAKQELYALSIHSFLIPFIRFLALCSKTFNFQFIRFWYKEHDRDNQGSQRKHLSIHSFLILLAYTFPNRYDLVVFQFIRFWYRLYSLFEQAKASDPFQFIRFWYLGKASARQGVWTIIFQFIRFWYFLFRVGACQHQKMSFNSFVSDTLSSLSCFR